MSWAAGADRALAATNWALVRAGGATGRALPGIAVARMRVGCISPTMG